MAERLLKAKKAKIAPKQAVSGEGDIVKNMRRKHCKTLESLCTKTGVIERPDEQAISSRILTIRGVQVILDRDIAALYGVETKVLNQAVKRNAERFPPDFMFQLNKDDCLRSQIVTLNGKRGEHLKYMPYAFTENGVAMLSGILRSPTAVETNIRIILDRSMLLHVGASLNHLGKKCFAFSSMDASNIPDIMAKIR